MYCYQGDLGTPAYKKHYEKKEMDMSQMQEKQKHRIYHCNSRLKTPSLKKLKIHFDLQNKLNKTELIIKSI
jgi:hypothetical protein